MDFTQLTGTRAEIRRLWSFFGVFYKRVPLGKPADVDWLPRRPETFDVQHSDALFLLDPHGQERIVDERMPPVSGRLSPALAGLLNDQGRHNLADPQFAWSPTDVIDDLYYLMNRNIPAGAGWEGYGPAAPTPTAAGELLGSGDGLAARLKALVVTRW